MSVVALDVGTSIVKAVRYDADGAESQVARRQVPLLRKFADWVEQDMELVRAAAVEAIREVATAAPTIRFLAVTGQGDGCWLVDADVRPLGPAILWCDGRAGTLVQRWAAEGVTAAVRERNGALVFPGSPGAILSWLTQHQPQTLRSARHALSCSAWVMACLTGGVRLEASDASNPWLDPVDGGYSPEILDLHGLSDFAHLLPPVVDATAGPLPILATAAAETGLPAGTPVVQAPYDVPATVIGAGAIKPGDAAAILGTSLVTTTTLGTFADTDTTTGSTIAMGVAGQYLHIFPSLVGTEALTWAAGILGLPDAAALVRLAETSPPGARGLVALPFLSSAGERVPLVDPGARAALWNLSFRHGRADIARALVEALTMVLRDCLDSAASKPTEVRVSGGAAASDFWCQLLADVTGATVTRVADAEVGARGAMMVGSMAMGDIENLSDAARAYSRTTSRFDPDATASTVYDDLFDCYRRARYGARHPW